jgi:hypothetical protein
MGETGRESRRTRTLGGHGGSWASSSQDFARLANLLFDASAQYAKETDGNCSIYALAGIPPLFSALRCLLIELNAGLFGDEVRESILEELASTSNDIHVMVRLYPIPGELRRNLEILVQLRHEIVHPAHRPGPEPNNTPEYMSSLREAGLLQSTGKETDYTWISQLQSHRLFRWAFEVIRDTVVVLMQAHDVNDWIASWFVSTYSKYLTVDTA